MENCDQESGHRFRCSKARRAQKRTRLPKTYDSFGEPPADTPSLNREIVRYMSFSVFPGRHRRHESLACERRVVEANPIRRSPPDRSIREQKSQNQKSNARNFRTHATKMEGERGRRDEKKKKVVFVEHKASQRPR